MSIQHTAPAIIGDVVAGAAVVASWSSNIRDDLSVLVTVMAGVWYLLQYGGMIKSWWRNK